MNEELNKQEKSSPRKNTRKASISKKNNQVNKEIQPKTAKTGNTSSSTKKNKNNTQSKKKTVSSKSDSKVNEEKKIIAKSKNSTSKKKNSTSTKKKQQNKIAKSNSSVNKTQKNQTSKNKVEPKVPAKKVNQEKSIIELSKTPTNKKKILNIIFDIIIAITIITIIILSILLYFKKKEENKTKQELIEAVIPRKIPNEELIEDESIKNEITELKTKYNNDDVYAILSIGNQDTSIPLVKGSDNDYYLNHSITKENSIIGSVFIGYRHDSTSRQINIYGHNSGNYDPPLRILEKYLFSEEYFRSNPSLELKIDNEVRKYQIFSVYPADKKSKEEHMQFNYQSELEWLTHFERMHQRSLYKTNTVFTQNDNVLVLQTCILYGKYQNKLLIVVAREIK